jgi:hypothetical protein
MRSETTYTEAFKSFYSTQGLGFLVAQQILANLVVLVLSGLAAWYAFDSFLLRALVVTVIWTVHYMYSRANTQLRVAYHYMHVKIEGEGDLGRAKRYSAQKGRTILKWVFFKAVLGHALFLAESLTRGGLRDRVQSFSTQFFGTDWRTATLLALPSQAITTDDIPTALRDVRSVSHSLFATRILCYALPFIAAFAVAYAYGFEPVLLGMLTILYGAVFYVCSQVFNAVQAVAGASVLMNVREK